jgi:hypothetical protein
MSCSFFLFEAFCGKNGRFISIIFLRKEIPEASVTKTPF